MKIINENADLEIRFVKNLYGKKVPEYFNKFSGNWERTLHSIVCSADDEEDFDFFMLVSSLLYTIEEYGFEYYDDFEEKGTYEMEFWEEYGENGIDLEKIDIKTEGC